MRAYCTFTSKRPGVSFLVFVKKDEIKITCQKDIGKNRLKAKLNILYSFTVNNLSHAVETIRKAQLQSGEHQQIKYKTYISLSRNFYVGNISDHILLDNKYIKISTLSSTMPNGWISVIYFIFLLLEENPTNVTLVLSLGERYI